MAANGYAAAADITAINTSVSALALAMGVRVHALEDFTTGIYTNSFVMVPDGNSLTLAQRGTPSFLVTEVVDNTGVGNVGVKLTAQANNLNIGELVFPKGTYRISTGTALPRGINYRFLRGAVITVDAVELNIRGTIEAGDYPIFNCINGGYVTGIRQVNAAWWGLTAGSAATLNARSIQAAHDCSEAVIIDGNGVPASDGEAIIRVPSGRWYMRQSVSLRPTSLFNPVWDINSSLLDGTSFVASASYTDGATPMFVLGTGTNVLSDAMPPHGAMYRETGSTCMTAVRIRNIQRLKKMEYRNLYVTGLTTGSSFTTAVEFMDFWSLTHFENCAFWLNNTTDPVIAIQLGTATGGERPADISFGNCQSVVNKVGDTHVKGRTNGGGINSINFNAGCYFYGGLPIDLECLGGITDEIGEIHVNQGCQFDSIGPTAIRARSGNGNIYNISFLGAYTTQKLGWEDETKPVFDIKLSGTGTCHDIQITGCTVIGFAGIAVDAFGWKGGTISLNRFRHIGNAAGTVPAVIYGASLVGTTIIGNTYTDNTGVGQTQCAAFVRVDANCNQVGVEQNWGGGVMPSVVNDGAVDSYIQGRDDGAGKANANLSNVYLGSGTNVALLGMRTTNTAAQNKALLVAHIAATSGPLLLHFPEGRWPLNWPAISGRTVTIEGAGSIATALVVTDAGNGPHITLTTGSQYASVKGVSLLTTGVDQGTAFSVDYLQLGFNDRNDVRFYRDDVRIRGEDITTQGWDLGFDLNNVNGQTGGPVSITGRMTGSTTTVTEANCLFMDAAIRLRGTVYPTDHRWSNLTVFGAKYAFDVDGAVEGLLVSDSVLVFVGKAVRWAPTAPFGGRPGFVFTSNHTHSFWGGTELDALQQVHITGNSFYHAATSTSNWIGNELTDCKGWRVLDNSYHRYLLDANPLTSDGVVIDGAGNNYGLIDDELYGDEYTRLDRGIWLKVGGTTTLGANNQFNGNYRIKDVQVDSSPPGYATRFVRASLSSSQSIPNATDTVIAFDTDAYDTLGVLSGTPGQFIIPPGKNVVWVEFVAHVLWDTNPNGDRVLFLYKNGSFFAGFVSAQMKPGPVSGGHLLVSGAISAVPGDIFTLVGYQSAGGTISAQGSGLTNMTMKILT